MNKRRLISNILFGALLVVLLFTPLGKQLKIAINKLTMGAPDIEKVEEADKLTELNYKWSYSEADGTRHSFSDTKGKVVFINQWATWCPPCVAEMPSIQKLYDSYKDNEQVVFIFLSGEHPDKTTAFLQKHNYTFPSYSYVRALPTPLFSQNIPATHIISPNGEILVSETGATNWNSEKVHELIDSYLN